MRNRRSEEPVSKSHVIVRRPVTRFLPHDGSTAKNSLRHREGNAAAAIMAAGGAWALGRAASEEDPEASLIIFEEIPKTDEARRNAARQLAGEINTTLMSLADLPGPAVKAVELLYGLDGSLERKEGVEAARALGISTDELCSVAQSITACLESQGKGRSWFMKAAARLQVLVQFTKQDPRELLLAS